MFFLLTRASIERANEIMEHLLFLKWKNHFVDPESISFTKAFPLV
jgi:hypothetical protein